MFRGVTAKVKSIATILIILVLISPFYAAGVFHKVTDDIGTFFRNSGLQHSLHIKHK